MPVPNGELNFISKLSDQMSELYSNSNHSDVAFVIDGVKLPAHKNILTIRSPYFRALLDGGFSESSKSEIELKVPLEAFKLVLRYIYTGRVSLQLMDHCTVIDILSLVHEYTIDELKSGISSYLLDILSMNNCCDLFEAARLYELKDLETVLYAFFDENAIEIMKTVDFKTLSSSSLSFLLQRSTFRAPEVEIFKSIVEWREHNQNVGDDDFTKVISGIRFELIDLEDLLSVVRNSSILDDKLLLDLIHVKTVKRTLNYRSICQLGINVASPRHDAKVTAGTNPLELLNGNYTKYDGNSGFTWHNISGSDNNCIIVELKDIFMINNLNMLLWDRDNRSYSYYIKVSTNKKQWVRVINHTASKCRSWQRLYFEALPVRYIMLVGTVNTANNVFHVVHLAARYLEDRPKLINGLIAPVSNVASKEQSSKVIEGRHIGNSDFDSVINGDFINYTEDSGFTYHSLGKGSIIIQLAQPYHIGSMRLRFWDMDNRTYSFFIETSTDKENWTMAVDKRNELLRSWQEFRFDARSIVFIKITGTFDNSGRSSLRLVHFEAPNNNST